MTKKETNKHPSRTFFAYSRGVEEERQNWFKFVDLIIVNQRDTLLTIKSCIHHPHQL